MADYFLSDVHLRLDEPERGLRLAQLVERLTGEDRLFVVGDLCDFWFAARQLPKEGQFDCPGLKALADFRGRGGDLTILAGNHDAWLGPFYERTLGGRFVPGSMELDLDGKALLIDHGHHLGARTSWKAGMESRAFYRAFRSLPDLAANFLEARLKSTNDAHQAEFDDRGLAIYREHVAALGDRYDVVILGHVHRPLDTGPSTPRLVVLGGWQRSTSYLIYRDGHFRHVVEAE